jgi:hypothetical protein
MSDKVYSKNVKSFGVGIYGISRKQHTYIHKIHLEQMHMYFSDFNK